MTQRRRILIGVGGGIAAYKVCDLVSRLAKAGDVEVRVVLTESAQQFVTPLTFATLSRHSAYTDQDFWQPIHGRPLHIDLGEWAEIMILAPLTANTLGKIVHGLADNLLLNTILASTCPVLVAPAMNTDMWQQQSVQRNWHQLQTDPRYHGMMPEAGLLACDRVGQGRMAEPIDIEAYGRSLLHTKGQRDLTGRHILISAGGTREYFDPVRFIGNPSTGKMGIALAQAAAHRGAEVTIVHGTMETALTDRLLGVRAIAVSNAAEMRQAILEQFPGADWTIMAAAVADVAPAIYTAHKLPKKDLPQDLPLTSVPDIAAELGQQKQSHQVLVGFAAQTGDIVPPALAKLERKQLDLIVANPVDVAGSGFGSDRNQAIILSRSGEKVAIAPTTKLALAHQIFDVCQQVVQGRAKNLG
ncbi:MAG: bifunctional phosphopantothenoylcysteine decarboxylase/phosphopantothenate--cysteine ligase CoaBC [Synechococcales cyanobacterium T60_A2020_003]|nr:bifunctional phosphopantothenoylcysteine decarboxylase/phosphopantothenate--cysteine ligase CoaBC [Synechococcales cyanobacterium T60_A2020_003]